MAAEPVLRLRRRRPARATVPAGRVTTTAEAYRVGASMSQWPVYVDGWQLECCGAAFAVGDEVEWTLTLSTSHSLLPELVVDFRGEVEEAASDQDRSGYIVRCGGLRAWVQDAKVTDRQFQMRGLLCEEHHGAIPEGVPPTRGRVHRIQMVTQPYVQAAERRWIPKPGEATLRDLTQSPPGFRHEEALPELRRIQTGLLVSLDVPMARTKGADGLGVADGSDGDPNPRRPA